MKATVIYVTLSDEHRFTINCRGWDCGPGRAYLAAREGDYSGAELYPTMLVEAATLEAVGAEAVWTRLQNGMGFRDHPGATILTEAPSRRSMDVGDIIRWEDGREERCASFGFEPVVR